MTQIPNDAKTREITTLADYQMKMAHNMLFDAKLYGPCQNKAWYQHITKILDELDDCIEELHTWKVME